MTTAASFDKFIFLLRIFEFFANRVVDTWNYLPDNIIDFNSLSAFKRTVKLIDFTMFLKCDWYLNVLGLCIALLRVHSTHLWFTVYIRLGTC